MFEMVSGQTIVRTMRRCASSKTDLDRIKRKAKQYKKTTGLTHSEALQQLSKMLGFNSYHELQTVNKRNPLDKRIVFGGSVLFQPLEDNKDNEYNRQSS